VQTAVNVVLVLGAGPEGEAAEAAIESALEAEEEATAEGGAGQIIFRTGSRTDTSLTSDTGVSFRNSVSSSADGQQIFRPGDKIWSVDTSQLPDGSAVFDDDPPGHVSVFATPDEIRAAVVASGADNFLAQLGFKMLEEPGSYKITK
jgi:hypothetical protein